MTNRHSDKQTQWQTDTVTNRHGDKQTHRQTDTTYFLKLGYLSDQKQKHKHTHTHTLRDFQLAIFGWISFTVILKNTHQFRQKFELKLSKLFPVPWFF